MQENISGKRTLKCRKRWIMFWTILMLITMTLLTAIVHSVLASSGGDYTLDWYTIEGGGGSSTGGGYSLSGTIGQPDAGALSGGNYGLSGGFWGGMMEALHELFLPLITR